MAAVEPRLAYVYHPRSFPTLSLVAAARGLCRLVWVIDSTDPEAASMARLLGRTGEVVDLAGAADDEAAERVMTASPDGIVTLADEHLALTAALAERLGLGFHSAEVAERLTDKALQRAALSAAGLPAPRLWVLDGPDDLDALAGDGPYPAVVKPRRGQGSRDTVPVGSADEAREFLAERWTETPRRPFVLEEYIPDGPPGVAGAGFADYVSVEAYVERGVFVPLATNGRTPPANPFRETGFFIPSALEPALEDEVVAMAEASARALGVERGCLHVEVKLAPTGPVVIEVNGRVGGGVPEMLADVAGVDLLAVAMRLALGLDPGVGRMPATTGVAFVLYLQAPSGMSRVESVEGLEAIRALEGVAEVELRRGPGQAVDWREGNHGHVASVRGTARGDDHLRELLGSIETLFRVVGSR